MNAAIECKCGIIIIYDSLHTTRMDCPECHRTWYSQPPLYSHDGFEAKKLPYLVHECGGTGGDDESAQRLIEAVKKVKGVHNKKLAFVFPEGKPSVVEL